MPKPTSPVLCIACGGNGVIITRPWNPERVRFPEQCKPCIGRGWTYGEIVKPKLLTKAHA